MVIWGCNKFRIPTVYTSYFRPFVSAYEFLGPPRFGALGSGLSVSIIKSGLCANTTNCHNCTLILTCKKLTASNPSRLINEKDELRFYPCSWTPCICKFVQVIFWPAVMFWKQILISWNDTAGHVTLEPFYWYVKHTSHVNILMGHTSYNLYFWVMKVSHFADVVFNFDLELHSSGRRAMWHQIGNNLVLGVNISFFTWTVVQLNVFKPHTILHKDKTETLGIYCFCFWTFYDTWNCK